MKKNGKVRKVVLITVLIAAVAGAGIWGISAISSRFRTVMGPGIQSVEVLDGSIESTVTGTGSLAFGDAESVRIPTGLDVVDVLEEQGSQIAAGQLLATVDRSAVEVRMSEVYEDIAEVDRQMQETPSVSDPVSITAPVAGRIVAMHLAEGSSVLEVLQRSQSLVTISTDGRLDATIALTNPEYIAQPDASVLLKFPDGTRHAATIREVDGETSFTAALQETGLGAFQEVTAMTPQGQEIGTGTTGPADAVNVMAPAGTVERISIALDETVKAGEAMFTVRPSGKPSAYLELEQRRKTLASTYDRLAAIYENGGITAPVAGTVVSCELTAGENTSNLDASSMGGASGLTMSAQDALNALSGGMRANAPVRAPEADSDSSSVDPDPGDSEEPGDAADADDQASREPDSSPDTDDRPNPVPTQDTAERTIPRLELPLVPPIAGLPLQEKIGLWPICTGTVTWMPDDVQAQFDTEYTAQVVLEALDGFRFAEDCTVAVLNGTTHNEDIQDKTLVFSVTYPATCTQIELPDIDWNAIQKFLDSIGGSLDFEGLQELVSSGLLPSSALGFDASSLLSGIDASALSGLSSADLAGMLGSESLAGALNAGDLAGALGGDASALYGSGMLPGGDLSQYISENTAEGDSDPVAYTIAPEQGMELVIQIDQMDILAVRAGMTCAVTVDALSGREFTGEVTSVSETADSNGGYAVHIAVPKDADMRAGMTASAVIVTQETDAVLTIPIAALQEDGNRVFVYTEYDADAEQLAGEVDVETGVSNGNEVEILSGLDKGQTVYYQQADMVEQMMRGGPGGSPDEVSAAEAPPAEAIATP